MSQLLPKDYKLILKVKIKDEMKRTYIGEMNQIGFKSGRGYFKKHTLKKHILVIM